MAKKVNFKVYEEQYDENKDFFNISVFFSLDPVVHFTFVNLTYLIP